MVSSLDIFTDFIDVSKAKGRKVQLPTGETSRITHLGSSSFLNGLPIKMSYMYHSLGTIYYVFHNLQGILDALLPCFLIGVSSRTFAVGM